MDSRVLRAKRDGERMWARRFFALVGGIWAATAGSFAVLVVNWTQPVSIAQFALMVAFLFSFSYVFAKRVLSLGLRPFPLPAVDRVIGTPRVAILYTTMNDVVPDCLRAVRQSYPCDVFVLDDSSDPTKRAAVDRLAAELGFRVVRRPTREGFKAGAINGWLRSHGTRYDYFVLLDADSVLPSDWVEHALRYAEHPDNGGTAIFQGMVNIWNTDRPFPAALAPTYRLSHDEWERKTAGYLGAIVCYGHNLMIRTKAILEIGGFVEDYVSEDFATAVALAERGYGSVFVPLHGWEALPENVRGFVRRQNKWTRGAMEFFSFAVPAKIPAYKKVMLLMIPWGHLAYVAIMAAIFLAVFGRVSSLGAFVAFGQNFLLAPVEYIWSIPLFRFILVLGLVTSIATAAKLAQVRLSLRRFYVARLLSKSVGSIMLPHEVLSMAMYVIDRRRKFPVTPKDEPPMTMREIARLARGTLLLIVVITVGLVLVNPVGLYYNALWLTPFYGSPFILHRFCGPHTVPRTMANGGYRDLLADPRLTSSVDRPALRW